MFEAMLVHSGQYKRYGDSYSEWNVLTKRSKEETVEWCLTELLKKRIPSSEEWHSNVRYGGARSGDYDYYFGGYYDIRPVSDGFRFIVCYPYAD